MFGGVEHKGLPKENIGWHFFMDMSTHVCTPACVYVYRTWFLRVHDKYKTPRNFSVSSGPPLHKCLPKSYSDIHREYRHHSMCTRSLWSGWTRYVHTRGHTCHRFTNSLVLHRPYAGHHTTDTSKYMFNELVHSYARQSILTWAPLIGDQLIKCNARLTNYLPGSGLFQVPFRYLC